MRLWLRGLIAAAVSGAAGGVLTGFASIGISPEHFNLQDPRLLIKLGIAAALVNSFVGLAAYLKQSPLPPE